MSDLTNIPLPGHKANDSNQRETKILIAIQIMTSNAPLLMTIESALQLECARDSEADPRGADRRYWPLTDVQAAVFYR